MYSSCLLVWVCTGVLLCRRAQATCPHALSYTGFRGAFLEVCKSRQFQGCRVHADRLPVAAACWAPGFCCKRTSELNRVSDSAVNEQLNRVCLSGPKAPKVSVVYLTTGVTFGVYLECIWNVSGMYLECMWSVSGRIWKSGVYLGVSGVYLECIWNVSGMYLECIWSVSGRIWNVSAVRVIWRFIWMVIRRVIWGHLWTSGAQGALRAHGPFECSKHVFYNEK